ncbi:MAG TPA: hypothetical protein VFZ11_03985, partial [Gemmatimonadaceae bacterium]
RGTARAVPAAVHGAAAAFALYGLLVLGTATYWQSVGGWANSDDYPRAIVRCVGMLATAWGLWRGLRWAWWIAVGLGSAFVVSWLVALLLVSRLSGDAPALPIPAVPAAVAAALVAIGVALLLLPGSRAAFRPREA